MLNDEMFYFVVYVEDAVGFVVACPTMTAAAERLLDAADEYDRWDDPVKTYRLEVRYGMTDEMRAFVAEM
jgi:hypothetical protein